MNSAIPQKSDKYTTNHKNVGKSMVRNHAIQTCQQRRQNKAEMVVLSIAAVLFDMLYGMANEFGEEVFATLFSLIALRVLFVAVSTWKMGIYIDELVEQHGLDISDVDKWETR